MNGNIEELTYSEVDLPTDIKYLGNGVAMIGSKIGRTINLLNIRSKEIVKKISFSATFTYIDCIDSEQLLIQYFNNPLLYRFDVEEEK